MEKLSLPNYKLEEILKGLAYCLQFSRKRKRTGMGSMGIADNIANREPEPTEVTQEIPATTSATTIMRSPKILRSRKNLNYRK